MDSWDEIRTAFQVARLGTVSGAAEALGVHHATVIRHVDALETRLGVKLFQRHARGYTPTEAGRDLLTVAQSTDHQFAQLAGRLRGGRDGIDGELVVTSIEALTHRVTPILVELQAAHPGLSVRYLTGGRLFRLEYGEAHVAIRAGAAPSQPDNVVQPLFTQSVSMVASDAYVQRHGLPEGLSDLQQHRFVCADENGPRAPFHRWLQDTVPAENIVFRVHDHRSERAAIMAGAGIGFVASDEAAADDSLHEVLPPREDWGSQFWLVTHVDLHRSAKVQAVLKALKEASKGWG
ncbi:LysR family transcriptional regulator [Pseudoroseicyclus aestuarii]|uniref:LysR family transcriptional regulator n=1 Tax=Pseudoroseicyclus aestuarii TaxID=1795041 RepID=A0A318SQ51_9RHOB|nr:LysR family transcriptional regulator [Pseudoroseicyclus aestuarii]PYE83802.1 LysR family transcriptional regulator [Pseudoroseicyclus aestuarii]